MEPRQKELPKGIPAQPIETPKYDKLPKHAKDAVDFVLDKRLEHILQRANRKFQLSDDKDRNEKAKQDALDPRWRADGREEIAENTKAVLEAIAKYQEHQRQEELKKALKTGPKKSDATPASFELGDLSPGAATLAGMIKKTQLG